MILNWLFLSLSLSFIKANNVAMTSSETSITATGIEDHGLILQQSASGQPVEQSLPTGVHSFHDISIDSANETLIFALSTVAQRVCSFILSNGTLTLVNCVGGNFAVRPFCGVSALDSTLIISGGTDGLTVYQYDTDSGVISDRPNVFNKELRGVIGHPDVVLVNSGVAALSTDFTGGAPRFGTIIAGINGNTVTNIRNFRVIDSLGFNFNIQPANFPLVNAIYETNDNTYMYTANGSMQVQTPLSSNTVPVLIQAPNGFKAVTVAVNTARKIAVFGGLRNSGGSKILFYDISVDPRNPILVEVVPVAGQRITSIASGGNAAAYTARDRANVQYVQLPITTPTSSPTNSPTISTGSPTNSPAISPTSSPVATVAPAKSPSSCTENETDVFLLRIAKNGKRIVRNCRWLAGRPVISRICKRSVDYFGEFRPPQDVCQNTCNSCGDCYENRRSRYVFNVKNNGSIKLRRCKILAEQSPSRITRICERTRSTGGYGPATRECPNTCAVGVCPL